MWRRARDYFASAIHEGDVPQKGTNMGVMILYGSVYFNNKTS